MPSSHTGSVADLFLKLVELDAEARAVRLAAVEDAGLRAEVAALLDADAEADARLGRLDRLAPVDVGTHVGRYRLLGEIGRGGMGVVYRARDERLGRDVAVKVLPRALAADPEARARLEAEARAASTLDHPNVCTVHALEETPDGGLALILAHYEGETLKARLARGPLPPEEAAGVLRQMAAGLAAAHAAGVVHRDVKPSNVLLGADGVVRVLDFGIARSMGSDLTATGATLGTAAYMAPEQTRGDRADARADVWALGAVLYEMLTGERPFGGRGDALVHAIRHDTPAPLPEGTREPLRRVVARALAKDPDDRFPDAAALLAALDAPPAAGRGWRRPAAWAAVALVVAATLWLATRAGGADVTDDVFVIAVAPFAAVGDGAEAEADVMQALVRRELDGVLAGEAGVRVVGAGGETPRSTAEAIALGERVGAHLVVWGEAVALRGEVEIRPGLARAVPFESLTEVAGGSSPGALLADLSAGDQLALRRTKAAEIGDLALHVAAHYHVGRGDFDRARTLLDRVRQPSAATASLRAWAALLQEDYETAEAFSREALAQDSTTAVSWFGLGIAVINQGRPADAEALLRRGLAIAPGDPALTSMLAWSLAAQGRAEESAATARAASRAAPDSQLGRLVLGWAAFMAGDSDGSVRAFGDLVARSRSRREAAMGHYGIAVVEQARGRLDVAEAAVREALRLVPAGADYLLLQGEIALICDDLPLAEDTFAQMAGLDLAPDYALTVPLVLAYVRARLGRPDDAPLRAVADTARGDRPLVPLYAFALGRVSEAEALASADRPDPSAGRDWRYEAHLHLGQLYEAGVGAIEADRTRALAHYREAVRRHPVYEGLSLAPYALRRLEAE